MTQSVSFSPGGFPFRWFLKGVLPAAFILLLLASVSRLSRIITWLPAQV